MVAVKAHEADRFVAAPPEHLRLFLVYGSDQGAITERARHLEQIALKRGGGETATRIGSDELSSDPGRIVDEVQSASLFGGEPVVTLRVADGRHNVIGAVAPVIDNPPDAAWLIIEAGDLAATSPLRKAFEKSDRAVAVPADSERLVRTPAYTRADQDIDFLQRDELRPTRLQIEYLKPHLTLQDHGVNATIVVFGGSRILEPEVARRRLEDARRALAEKPGDPDLERRVAVAERVVAKSPYYDVARQLGRRIAEAGGGPDDPRVLVATGGGPGIMEAANRGAHDIGAPSIGLNILLPHEQFPNPYITPDLCFQFRYFALRKMHFLMRARALIAFPGGYGTFDELFETLCLIQTRKIDPLPVVLVGKEFWRRAVDVDFLADEGVIAPQDKDLFTFAETADEAWQAIVDWYRAAGRELFE